MKKTFLTPGGRIYEPVNEMFDAIHIGPDYMIEMSFRHPIMYFLWYRWWIPTLMSEEYRKDFPTYMKNRREIYVSYWAGFAQYHPVLFLWYALPVLFFQGTIKFFSASIKVIGRFFKSPITKERFDDVLIDEKFVE